MFRRFFREKNLLLYLGLITVLVVLVPCALVAFMLNVVQEGA